MIEDKVECWVKGFFRGTLWREPIVSFNSADSTEILPKVIPNHLTAEEILDGAKGVIVYFIPFSSDVVRSNVEGLRPSRLWAEAYVKTNEAIERLNRYISKKLEAMGFKCSTIKPTHNFDERTLTSFWSHKHVAYLSGLGTFGHHTMIITERGCCGRLGSLVTTAEFCEREPMKEGLCNKCFECVERCPFGALSKDGLDKRRCYEVLMKNSKIYGFFADVCGKCACGVPCQMSPPK